MINLCKKTNYKIPNPRIDKCMKYLIEAINNGNMKTVACCCGHNKYPMTILVKNKYIKNSPVIELRSGKIIPRKRKFYKRDKQGYYYIPEVKQNG